MTPAPSKGGPSGPGAARLPRVLVAEDDYTSRESLRIVLERCGYAVVTAQDVPSAREELAAWGFEAFDCVVTDYRMPEFTGLDLLAWLNENSSRLATIILTAEGEKSVVTEALRGGAADFLEKPVNLQRLRDTVGRAVIQTRRQRHTAEVELAVRDLGRAQQSMLLSRAGAAAAVVEVCFHPKQEAGGDFFSHFEPAAGEFFCLATDVSGHDLQAAYVSAYFQGVVRGMLKRAAPLPEVLTFFNRLLLDEWSGSGAGASVALTAILVDMRGHAATVVTCGAPAPVYVQPGGRGWILGAGGGAPLGWFEEFTPASVTHPAARGGMFLLWTDGLEDLAERLGADPLSLGYALERARAQGRKLPELAGAADDILFARVTLGAGEAGFEPLVMERYPAGSQGRIDAMQAGWERSLALALPELESAARHDLLLASREAVLNGLQHGCRGRPEGSVLLQIGCDPAGGRLRVWVEDPGPGHQFNVEAYEREAAERLLTEHRGLILMRHLAAHLAVERNGATVVLDFEMDPEPEPNGG